MPPQLTDKSKYRGLNVTDIIIHDNNDNTKKLQHYTNEKILR